MKRATFKCLFALLSSLFVDSRALALTYDAVNDFSYTNNPNGAWSYGWEHQLGDSFNLDATNSGTGWIGIDGFNDSNIWKNLDSVYHNGVAPGEISMQTGRDTDRFAVVRWTSPIDGVFSIDGYFGAGDTGINGWGYMSYFVYHNNSPEYSLHQTYGDGYFNLSDTVHQGDTIDFIIGEAWAWGNTPLHADITLTGSLPVSGNPIPAPSTMSLIFSALVGFFVFSSQADRNKLGRNLPRNTA